MGQLDRIREAQREVRYAAMQRWRARAGERSENQRQLQEGGPGAADSPMRNARYAAREAAFSRARELRSVGRLPIGIERKLGPTLDFVPFAPSDGARLAGRPVARVVTLGGEGTQPEGFATSFMVSNNLLLTNHHVFPSRLDAVGVGANFLYERTDRGLESGTIFELEPDKFFLNDEKLDFALVAVSARSLNGAALTDFGYAPLVEATPKILIGQPVNIIQHPEGGEKQYAIAQNRLIDLLDSGFLHYETDTLEGSSGSPVFSKDWQLIGLHHASIPEMDGEHVVAVGGGYWEEGMPDERVHWIANEGIRVSTLVKFLGAVKMDNPKQQAMLNALMSTTTDPADDLVNEMRTPISPPIPITDGRIPPSMTGNNTFNFTGPVTIHVYAPTDTLQVAQTVNPRSTAVLSAEKVIRFDPDYAGRDGYDPRFLDPEDDELEVEAPRVAPDRAGELYRDGDKPLLLKYHHFSIVMNKGRRLQMWSAANVDYDPELKSTRDRKEFGTDKWIPDPRLPGEFQLIDAEFYKPAGNIDRGHIVRREDNAWGFNEEEIEFANADTFHWTNCTPQHEAFNQSAPGRNDGTYVGMTGLWGDFENYVQGSLKGEDTKACILAGPVLDDRDPSRDSGFGEVKYPLQFWKIIAVPQTIEGVRKLKVFGFTLSQADVVRRFGIEVFRPGRFKMYQVSLAENHRTDRRAFLG